MSGVNIGVNGIKPVEDLIGRIRQLQGLRNGIRAGALYLKGRAAVYPRVRRGKQPFKTLKQQHGFFAKLKKGEITVPYTRGSAVNSERLAQRWAISIRDNGLTGVIGNNASYAELVYSKGKQALYHKKTGWKTVERIARDESKNVKTIVYRAVGQSLKK